MLPTPTPDIQLYQSPDGQIRLDVQLDHDTVWLTQAQMVTLFDISKKTVSEHIGNVFKENELDKTAVVRESRTTAADGKSYFTNYYNLDVIISVGYRVKSKRGTSFRQWATQVLRQYLVQGFVLNEQRLRESARQLADLKRLVQPQAEVARS
ncbi:virulence RhuM family protein [Hymenobacter psoromatis]|uniref:virulence RhuM family protein n=1 Tax=Hymenobacter psoromatis TaxID=1484116 RepID=UPI001CBA7D9A|nr:RhuM family protein [Hymenobacter psoromatis]